MTYTQFSVQARLTSHAGLSIQNRSLIMNYSEKDPCQITRNKTDDMSVAQDLLVYVNLLLRCL